MPFLSYKEKWDKHIGHIYIESGNGDKYSSIADITPGNFSVLSRDLVSAGYNILYDYILNGLASFRRKEKWHGQSFSDMNRKVVGNYRSESNLFILQQRALR